MQLQNLKRFFMKCEPVKTTRGCGGGARNLTCGEELVPPNRDPLAVDICNWSPPPKKKFLTPTYGQNIP